MPVRFDHLDSVAVLMARCFAARTLTGRGRTTQVARSLTWRPAGFPPSRPSRSAAAVPRSDGFRAARESRARRDSARARTAAPAPDRRLPDEHHHVGLRCRRAEPGPRCSLDADAPSRSAQLQEDARRRLKRAAWGDEPARLRQVDARVVRHDRGAREVEAKTDELVEAPDTSPLQLGGVIGLGRQPDLVGLIDVSSMIDSAASACPGPSGSFLRLGQAYPNRRRPPPRAGLQTGSRGDRTTRVDAELRRPRLSRGRCSRPLLAARSP